MTDRRPNILEGVSHASIQWTFQYLHDIALQLFDLGCPKNDPILLTQSRMVAQPPQRRPSHGQRIPRLQNGVQLLDRGMHRVFVPPASGLAPEPIVKFNLPIWNAKSGLEGGGFDEPESHVHDPVFSQ
ncbi:MAG: hypothetical protein L6R38_005996 [Xanthoria sp. 2 TBL-2021]|nr:MAG: hypothetical protein L6R38_005996 [Xanthoria sp. 2 TBL-2021]